MPTLKTLQLPPLPTSSSLAYETPLIRIWFSSSLTERLAGAGTLAGSPCAAVPWRGCCAVGGPGGDCRAGSAAPWLPASSGLQAPAQSCAERLCCAGVSGSVGRLASHASRQHCPYAACPGTPERQGPVLTRAAAHQARLGAHAHLSGCGEAAVAWAACAVAPQTAACTHEMPMCQGPLFRNGERREQAGSCARCPASVKQLLTCSGAALDAGCQALLLRRLATNQPVRQSPAHLLHQAGHLVAEPAAAFWVLRCLQPPAT